MQKRGKGLEENGPVARGNKPGDYGKCERKKNHPSMNTRKAGEKEPPKGSAKPAGCTMSYETVRLS